MVVLGVDIGTTAVKAVIIDCIENLTISLKSGTFSSFAQTTLPQNATIVGLPNGYDEQDVLIICRTLFETVKKLPLEQRKKVNRIQICGQMHGVVLWKNGCLDYLWSQIANKSIIAMPQQKVQFKPVSNLITWRDKRCDEELLKQINDGNDTDVHAGYAMATMAWMHKQDEIQLQQWQHAGTIMDLVTCLLTEINHVTQHPSLAASWGMFDCQENAWQVDRIAKHAKSALRLLPTITEKGSMPLRGRCHTEVSKKWKLPKGVVVGTAVGDAAAQVFAFNLSRDDALLNIGTSAQLTMLHCSGNTVKQRKSNMNATLETQYAIELRPAACTIGEFDQLLVIAALTGYQAFSWLVRQRQMYKSGSYDQVSTELIALGLQRLNTALLVRPTFWHERFQPNLSALIDGVEFDLNSTIDSDILSKWSWGDLAAAFCRGIVKNMIDLCYQNVDREIRERLSSLHRLVVVGGGASNPLIIHYVKVIFGVPIDDVPKDIASYAAAIGAAKLGFQAARLSKHAVDVVANDRMDLTDVDIFTIPSLQQQFIDNPFDIHVQEISRNATSVSHNPFIHATQQDSADAISMASDAELFETPQASLMHRLCYCNEVGFSIIFLLVLVSLALIGLFIYQNVNGSIQWQMFKDPYHEQTLIVIISGVFALLATVLSCIQVYQHLQRWVHPPSQGRIVRILIMVPIYAICSWLSTLFMGAALYFDFIISAYEAYVIYSFLLLLTKYLGGNEGVVEVVSNKPPFEWPFPLNHCKWMGCKPVRGSDKFVWRLKHGTLQYTIIAPLCAVMVIILNASGLYDEGDYSITRGYLWITLIINCSQMVAIFCLIWFYLVCREELAPFKPVPKFVAIKSVVFLTFWQGMVISGLATINILHDQSCDPAVDSYCNGSTVGLTSSQEQILLQGVIICIEMFIIAISHKWIFDVRSYESGRVTALMEERALQSAQIHFDKNHVLVASEP